MRHTLAFAAALLLAATACAPKDDGLGGMTVRAKDEPVSQHCAGADATFRAGLPERLDRMGIRTDDRFGETTASLAIGLLADTLPGTVEPAREEGCVIEIMSSSGFRMTAPRVGQIRDAYRTMRARG